VVPARQCLAQPTPTEIIFQAVVPAALAFMAPFQLQPQLRTTVARVCRMFAVATMELLPHSLHAQAKMPLFAQAAILATIPAAAAASRTRAIAITAVELQEPLAQAMEVGPVLAATLATIPAAAAASRTHAAAATGSGLQEPLAQATGARPVLAATLATIPGSRIGFLCIFLTAPRTRAVAATGMGPREHLAAAMVPRIAPAAILATRSVAAAALPHAA